MLVTRKRITGILLGVGIIGCAAASTSFGGRGGVGGSEQNWANYSPDYVGGVALDPQPGYEPTYTVTPTATPTSTPVPATSIPPTLVPFVPTAVPPAAVYSGGEEGRLLAALAEVGFATWTWPKALAVAQCESGLNQYATGAAGERGIFQIHPIHNDSTYDYLGNVRAAYRISGGGVNWGAWSCG